MTPTEGTVKKQDMGEGYPTYTLDGCWGVRAAGVVAATGDRVCPDEPSCDVRSAEAKSNSKDDNM